MRFVIAAPGKAAIHELAKPTVLVCNGASFGSRKHDDAPQAYTSNVAHLGPDLREALRDGRLHRCVRSGAFDGLRRVGWRDRVG